LHPHSAALSRGSLTREVVAAVVADIPRQLRIRKLLHRILLRCRIQVVAVVRIQAAARLISLDRGPVAVRIQAAVLLILLARGPGEANIPAAVLLILLARGPGEANIPAAVLLILLARIQAQRHTLRLAAARILLLQVMGPVVVRIMRLRRSARPMRHKVISPANAPALPQSTISTRMLRTAISMPTSAAGTLQIV
jgi:hypothetical protein